MPPTTMTITAAEGASPIVSTIAVTPTLSMTFVSSLATMNFTIGDITAANGVMSSFAGTGTTYTATFTPTAGFNGDCTIRVRAGAYTTLAGPNLATDIFYYIVNAPVVSGFEFEANLPVRTPATEYRPTNVSGFEFETDEPRTVAPGDYRGVAVRGFMIEGDFPARGGGIQAFYSAS